MEFVRLIDWLELVYVFCLRDSEDISAKLMQLNSLNGVKVDENDAKLTKSEWSFDTESGFFKVVNELNSLNCDWII